MGASDAEIPGLRSERRLASPRFQPSLPTAEPSVASFLFARKEKCGVGGAEALRLSLTRFDGAPPVLLHGEAI